MALIIWPLGAMLFFLTGHILFRALDIRVSDPVARFALECATGLAVWPIFLMWASVLRIPLRPFTLQVLGIGILVLGSLSLILRPPHIWRRRRRYLKKALPFLLVVFVLAAIVIQTRVAHIRGLALPPWVDSIHHTMITQLILDDGGIPETYDPYISGAPFAYHFGFHANLAVLCSLLGHTEPVDVATTMLHFGQLLNTLVFFVIYAGGRLILRSRCAALLAACIATLVSWFPAFYASWGRYPHLAGVILLVSVVLLWRLALAPGLRMTILAALLVSGLMVTHVRVAFFMATLLLILFVRLAWKRQWLSIGALILTLVAAGLVSTPFFLQVTKSSEIMGTIDGASPLSESESHRSVQQDLLWAPNNRLLIAASTAGISEFVLHDSPRAALLGACWWLLLIILAERAKRNRPNARMPWTPLLVMGSWCLLTALLLPVRMGQFELSRIVSWNSAVITLFVPLSIATAALVMWVIDQTVGMRFRFAGGAFVITAAICGMLTMQRVVKDSTVLASADDLSVLEWSASNLPKTSRLAAQYRPWLGDSWVGKDGGAWIPVLTELDTVVPPALYAWSLPDEQVADINRRASRLNELEGASWKDISDRCRSMGATHFYTSSGIADEAAIPSLVFAEGSASIYAIPATP